MKLQIASDLHLEMDFRFPNAFKLDKVEKDILVLAGDIGVGITAKDFILAHADEGPVIFLCGNHEFYNRNFQEITEQWKEIAEGHENLYFLNNEGVEINGQDFYGGTMWTNCDFNEVIEKAVERGLNDFRLIKYGEHMFNAKDMQYEQAFFTANLFKALEKNENTIVITHHLPHFACVKKEKWGGRETYINYGFANDTFTEVFGEYKIPLWIHGHTHDKVDTMINHTRIVCNPRGYGYENKEFDRGLVIKC